jgi:hypothetical protein
MNRIGMKYNDENVPLGIWMRWQNAPINCLILFKSVDVLYLIPSDIQYIVKDFRIHKTDWVPIEEENKV